MKYSLQDYVWGKGTQYESWDEDRTVFMIRAAVFRAGNKSTVVEFLLIAVGKRLKRSNSLWMEMPSKTCGFTVGKKRAV